MATHEATRSLVQRWREARAGFLAAVFAPHNPGTALSEFLRERAAEQVQVLRTATLALSDAVRNAGLDVVTVRELSRRSAIGAGQELRDLIERVGAIVDLLDEASSEPMAAAPPKQTELDVRTDPGCVVLRTVLKDGPKLLGAIARTWKGHGPVPARRRTSDLLRAMEVAGLTKQTANRGAWALTDAGREQQRRDR